MGDPHASRKKGIDILVALTETMQMSGGAILLTSVVLIPGILILPVGQYLHRHLFRASAGRVHSVGPNLCLALSTGIAVSRKRVMSLCVGEYRARES